MTIERPSKRKREITQAGRRKWWCRVTADIWLATGDVHLGNRSPGGFRADVTYIVVVVSPALVAQQCFLAFSTEML